MYNRAAHYGGAATNSPAGQAIRVAGEGQSCPMCGEPMVSGTDTAPIPEHSPPLVQHYYEYGGLADDARGSESVRSELRGLRRCHVRFVPSVSGRPAVVVLADDEGFVRAMTRSRA